MAREPDPAYRGPYRGPHFEHQHGYHWSVYDLYGNKLADLKTTGDEINAAYEFVRAQHGATAEPARVSAGTFQAIVKEAGHSWSEVGVPFRLRRGQPA